ncbi:MAG: DUF1349 domain-containing protein, partial [Planctomycetes bacterium]|nr:DUF1349 domain-containing protein [Planctomycetota bacterium]
VAFWDTPLSAADIAALGKAGDKFFTPKRASAPAPADGATDVPRDATLSWKAVEYPCTHDVYLGTTAADVDSATRANTKGVLLSRGQADTTFDPPGLLAYGRTYYWRIDEVNQSPDGTVAKGNVWSFTVEPYAYAVKPVSAIASSFQTDMGPAKTIDGSGLTGDLHGTAQTTMWMSTGALPNWIQYTFDKVYKFHELQVWNSNQIMETYVGFGAKDVTIEFSTDGTTWTALAAVPQFARATALAGYAANTTVSLGGIQARYIKLTIDSTWGGSNVCGLSEVRFSYVPVQAWSPQPANAATGVAIDTALNWRPGREAGSHQVFFGADQAAIAGGTAPAQTVADHSFTPGALNFGATYYWRVDEVNTVSYPGDLWRFTTQQYAAVDNFETYTNDEGGRIYEAWVDGWTNGSGSVVGHLVAPFAETSIVHSGRQSMPLEYNNVKSPYYSEAERTFSSPQDWTGNGADTLSLFYRGYTTGFLDKGNNTFTVSAGGADIWGTADQFRFVFKALNGDGSMVVRVDSIGNTHAWAKAGPMIRETLEANARNACVVVTPGNGVSFQWRPTTAAASSNAPTAGLRAPYWVRLTRTGNVFKAERSADGKTWTQQGSDTTIGMATAVYIGLAVTSHNAAATTTAEFSNLAITGAVTGSWQALAIGAAMPSNDPAPLYLRVEDRTGKTKTVVNPNASATTVTAWTEWRIPLSELSAAGVNTSAIKKLALGIGDRTSPKPGGAGLLYLDDIGFGHPVK